LALAAGLSLAGGQTPPAPAPLVNVMTIEGVIDPAMADFLERALGQAEANRAQCLIIRFNTPGGLGTSMDKMVGLLLNSPLPVAVYVAPAGAQAFSAGTFVTLAANFAVMNPNSSIGAAHPMQLFSVPSPGGEEPGGGQAEEMMKKITNAYATKIRTIAEKRGRNADWAEKAVRNSKSSTAQEALELKVIDSLQPNQAALLRWLEGKPAQVADGKTVILHTRGARVEEIEPSSKDRFLHQLADPNLLIILMALAVMGIIFELKSPGTILPGVVGGISLLLALYSISVLPVTTTGLALMVFGLLLLLLEIKVPSHGILTIGGLTGFVIGGLLLIDEKRYKGVMTVSWQILAILAVLLGLFFFFAIGAAVRAQLRRPTTGKEGLMGKVGRALSGFSPELEGEVFVEGERWRALSKQGNISPEEKVIVTGLEGLTLIVQAAEPGEDGKQG
jgi:membrane-bound serine protease (ClpP class)